MPKPNPLDEFIEASAQDDIKGIVPNQKPIIHGQSYRIAIIGEAPGADEVREGKPFIGYSGQLLNGLLAKANVIRDACFVGNVCQTRPPENDITKFSLEGKEITEGLEKLAVDLREFDPHVCLLLGNTPLWAAKGVKGISKWRGTFFLGDRGPFAGRKCISSYHPANCLRDYSNKPMLMFDIIKMMSQARSPELVTPRRDLRIRLSLTEILNELDRFNREGKALSIDIEGYVDAMTCLSIANAPDYSVLIPFTNHEELSYWSVDEEVAIWQKLTTVLGNPLVPKIFQNGLYDRFVFQYSYGVVVRGNQDDTMLKHWEMYCELEKSLGVQVSLYCGTEPYYKFERKSANQDTHWMYCCKDSANTWEIADKLNKWLPVPSRKHYAFNMDLLHPMLYMENHGLRYNIALAEQRLQEVDNHLYGLQGKLDLQATIDYALYDQRFGFDWSLPKPALLAQARAIMSWKKDPNKPVKKFEQHFDKVMALLKSDQPLTAEDRGFLSIACKLSMNIRSNVKKKKNEEKGFDSVVERDELDEGELGARSFKYYIYVVLGLPKQYTKDAKTKKMRLSSNYESLLKLSKKSNHPCLQLAIDISSLRTRSQMLHISCDADGRVRAGYNVVGSETGRITCYTSPTGSGYALQILPDEDTLKPVGHPLRLGMRDLIMADEGCYLGKFDLKGADGWTVGAHLNKLGDPTMLQDLLFGIKPAQVLCWMMRHQESIPTNMPREEVLILCKEVKKEDWDYFAYKQCIWGFCYLMGARKAASHVFNLSEGKVAMSEDDMERAKSWLFRRYRVKLWWEWLERYLAEGGYNRQLGMTNRYPPTMISGSGQIRKFFNRPKDALGEALAHEPQTATTYATNSAARNLWMDPDNRYYVGNRCLLRIKPMHQVHDELLVQFRQEDVEFAKTKIKQWFNNPIDIAGQKILIPYEGSYGHNWAMDDKSKVGSL